MAAFLSQEDSSLVILGWLSPSSALALTHRLPVTTARDVLKLKKSAAARGRPGTCPAGDDDAKRPDRQELRKRRDPPGRIPRFQRQGQRLGAHDEDWKEMVFAVGFLSDARAVAALPLPRPGLPAGATGASSPRSRAGSCTRKDQIGRASC